MIKKKKQSGDPFSKSVLNCFYFLGYGYEQDKKDVGQQEQMRNNGPKHFH